MKTIYQQNGFANRDEYLAQLAKKFNDEEAVMAFAYVLGPEEDFDGLISMLEDL